MRYIFFFLLLVSSTAYSQCKEFIIGVKGDTLNCVDFKGLKQGRWVVKVETLRGERGYEEEGVYKNGQKSGVWRRFSLEGDLIAIENYRWGQKDGRNVYFNHMGEPMREESWRAIDPQNPYDTVNVYDVQDPTKVIGRKVVKVESASVKHGTWKFYDPFKGTVEETQQWYMDKPARKEGDELLPIEVSDNTAAVEEPDAPKKNVTKPREVVEFEKKNAGKKKIKVRTGATGG
jgi:antitoxin component YwqK of YwqJK toxin-antitoxin module